MRQTSATMNGNQTGFTLIEVLVALAVTGFIGSGIALTVSQVINVNARSNNHVVVLKQVESAAYWVSHDVRMAQVIQPSGVSGFPLSLSWVEWDNTTHQVSYTIDSGKLQRSSSVNGTPPVPMVVARHINSNADNTSCQYANGVFTFKMTASSGGFQPVSETRMAEVLPRSAQ